MILVRAADGSYRWGWDPDAATATNAILHLAGPNSRIEAFFHTDRGELEPPPYVDPDLQNQPGYFLARMSIIAGRYFPPSA